MRSLVAFLLVLLLAAAGYTFYWHKKADDFRTMVEQSIASINEQAKPLTKDAPLIRYESIATSGFPFAMTLEITKPVVDFPVSAYLQAAYPHPTVVAATVSPPAPPAGAPPAPGALAVPVPPVTAQPLAAVTEWIEEIGYGQSIAFSGNITGNRFTLTVSGNRTHQSLVGGKPLHTLVSSSQTPLVCHLAVEHPWGWWPWAMQPVFTDLPTFLAAFRSGDCDVRGITLKNVQTDQPLFTADRIYARAANEAGDVSPNRRVALDVEYGNARALPAFDAVVGDYRQWTAALMGAAPPPAGSAIAVSEYGAQNVKLNARYDGPVLAADLFRPTMRLKLDINHFDVSNALFTSDLAAHLLSEPQASQRTASFELHAHSEVTERYDQLLVQQLALTLGRVWANGAPGLDPAVLQLLARLGTPQEVAETVLPKLHALGKMATDIQLSVQGSSDPDALIRHGNYNLARLDWVTTPYGLKLRGHSLWTLPNKLPSGDLVITCLSCDALVTAMGDYAMRVEHLVSRLRPGQPPVLTPALVEGIKQFVHGIAENGSASDLVLDFAVKDSGEILIAGKPLLQAIGLFGTTVAPHLPQGPPPAGTTGTMGSVPPAAMPALPAPPGK